MSREIIPREEVRLRPDLRPASASPPSYRNPAPPRTENGSGEDWGAGGLIMFGVLIGAGIVGLIWSGKALADKYDLKIEIAHTEDEYE